jgi:hypothetical protein
MASSSKSVERGVRCARHGVSFLEAGPPSEDYGLLVEFNDFPWASFDHSEAFFECSSACLECSWPVR